MTAKEAYVDIVAQLRLLRLLVNIVVRELVIAGRGSVDCHTFEDVLDLGDLVDVLLSDLFGLVEGGVLVQYLGQLRLLCLDSLQMEVALAHIADQPVNLGLEIVPRRKRSQDVKPTLVALKQLHDRHLGLLLQKGLLDHQERLTLILRYHIDQVL